MREELVGIDPIIDTSPPQGKKGPQSSATFLGAPALE